MNYRMNFFLYYTSFLDTLYVKISIINYLFTSLFHLISKYIHLSISISIDLYSSNYLFKCIFLYIYLPIYRVSLKKVSLWIFRKGWVIFSKLFLNSKLQPISMSFEKEISILGHIVFLLNC